MVRLLIKAVKDQLFRLAFRIRPVDCNDEELLVTEHTEGFLCELMHACQDEAWQSVASNFDRLPAKLQIEKIKSLDRVCLTIACVKLLAAIDIEKALVHCSHRVLVPTCE